MSWKKGVEPLQARRFPGKNDAHQAKFSDFAPKPNKEARQEASVRRNRPRERKVKRNFEQKSTSTAAPARLSPGKKKGIPEILGFSVRKGQRSGDKAKISRQKATRDIS